MHTHDNQRMSIMRESSDEEGSMKSEELCIQSPRKIRIASGYAIDLEPQSGGAPPQVVKRTHGALAMSSVSFAFGKRLT